MNTLLVKCSYFARQVFTLCRGSVGVWRGAIGRAMLKGFAQRNNGVNDRRVCVGVGVWNG